ncbi:MAG: flavodoxin-dependent (E)-4-hydroxy-3-methylbut-2-enyl-diphosphate synthase [Clostridiales Family XIII bacterium]|jgi:(E)-4-hydroxy-3-methylbut-2-enyl-diphosphate synthase|nr:flavodoxin-dependent (E)-4-hydroxy-3-methylbut-2-enyl-diphosphate synthase [Clostridiales Family XIII bacterium]
MTRRKSRAVNCGGVIIGGEAPISIQSMTNTDTRDVKATIRQIEALSEAGCDIVRVAAPDMEAVEALGAIKRVRGLPPIVADIHFDYRLAIAAIEAGADKIRINPGNIGGRENVKRVVECAKTFGIPIRIGVNAGSLEREIAAKYGGATAEAAAESALKHIAMLEDMDFDNIVVSIKMSDIRANYEAHMIAAANTEYPFHIGVTEAGYGMSGVTKSTVGIGALLMSGVGDTLRVSLTGDPVKEAELAAEILKSLDLKDGAAHIVSCPTCGRCHVDLEALVKVVESGAREMEKRIKGRAGADRAASVTVAVMGCAVNGPGEAAHADVGVACGNGKGLIFQNGSVIKTVGEKDIASELLNRAEALWLDKLQRRSS